MKLAILPNTNLMSQLTRHPSLKISARAAAGLIALVLVLALVGCGGDDLKKQEDLGGLRILALQAGNNGGAAEFSPGDSVTVTPWISDYKGGSRTLTFEGKACLDFGVSVGADPSCENVPGAISFSGAVPTPATERVGSGPNFNVTIPPTILNGRSDIDQHNGVSYIVTYRLIASDGASTNSFKRLVVITRTSKNQNPTLNGITSNGAAFTAWPAGEVEIKASYTPGSIESYTLKKTDGTPVTRTEELITSWMKTAGKVSATRTINESPAKFTPEGTRPTDHTPVIVGIARDGRGGVSVVVQTL